jgi:hypothetical protein
MAAPLPVMGSMLYPEYSRSRIVRPMPRYRDGRPAARPVRSNILPGQPIMPAVMPPFVSTPVPLPVAPFMPSPGGPAQRPPLFPMPARGMYGSNPALNPIGLSFPMMPQPMLQPAASLRDSELMLRRPGQ